jgi:protein tyrosine phosphatase (PTP) superfamily phosphohydrolase (DUF442 family)
VLLVVVIVLRRPLFQGNFGVVDPGRVYRSAQPGGQFRKKIREWKLGSVVNLRGGTPLDAFYRNELAAADELGIQLYDVPLNARQRPSRGDLMRLLRVLDQCEYPLLIHCKWGSDRTGLMAALYRMDKLGEPPEKAIQSFSIAHGHVPFFGPEKLHEPIDEYAKYLRDQRLNHTPAQFRRWLETEFSADEPFKVWPTVKPGPRPPESPAGARMGRLPDPKPGASQ